MVVVPKLCNSYELSSSVTRQSFRSAYCINMDRYDVYGRGRLCGQYQEGCTSHQIYSQRVSFKKRYSLFVTQRRLLKIQIFDMIEINIIFYIFVIYRMDFCDQQTNKVLICL